MYHRSYLVSTTAPRNINSTGTRFKSQATKIPSYHTVKRTRSKHKTPRNRRCQETASQGKTCIGQGCKSEGSTLKPSIYSIASVKVNTRENAVRQGDKVPYPDIFLPGMTFRHGYDLLRKDGGGTHNQNGGYGKTSSSWKDPDETLTRSSIEMCDVISTIRRDVACRSAIALPPLVVQTSTLENRRIRGGCAILRGGVLAGVLHGGSARVYRQPGCCCQHRG